MKPMVFAAVAAVLLAAAAPAIAREGGGNAVRQKLAALEAAYGGRLGVSAVDTGSGARVAYRASERFPFCSTFKVLAVSAVLKQSMADAGLLERRILYTKEYIVSWSPVTEKSLASGMRVAELCDAAIRHSDNTAANLLLKLLGGPGAVTAFARSIGDTAFRLDRWETALNSAIPGDPRDTTTPGAMEKTLRRLVLGDALAAPQRDLLVAWLKGNTTGGAGIRAGVPQGWTIGDKTGSGEYGTTNHIGVLWPPEGSPIVIAIYFTQPRKDAPAKREIIAEATRVVLSSLR